MARVPSGEIATPSGSLGGPIGPTGEPTRLGGVVVRSTIWSPPSSIVTAALVFNGLTATASPLLPAGSGTVMTPAGTVDRSRKRRVPSLTIIARAPAA